MGLLAGTSTPHSMQGKLTCIIDPSGTIKSYTCSASTTQTTSLALVVPSLPPLLCSNKWLLLGCREKHSLFRRPAKSCLPFLCILSEIAQTENNSWDQCSSAHAQLTYASPTPTPLNISLYWFLSLHIPLCEREALTPYASTVVSVGDMMYRVRDKEPFCAPENEKWDPQRQKRRKGATQWAETDVPFIFLPNCMNHLKVNDLSLVRFNLDYNMQFILV